MMRPFQPLFDNIRPYLPIRTGTILYEGKYFGYFCICPNPYELYCVPCHCKFDVENKLTNTYFIRHGSTTTIMTEEEKAVVRQSKAYHEAEKQSKLDSLQQKQRTLAEAAVFGSWNQNFAGDRESIEYFTGQAYNSWIRCLQEYSKDSQYVELKNGVWAIQDRLKILQNYGNLFLDEDIERLRYEIINIFSTHHPKYEHIANERWCVTDKNKYSEQLIRGIFEFLAIIGNNKGMFSNCSFRTSGVEEYLILSTIRQLFSTRNWMIYPTIECGIEFLAESKPQYFLEQIGQEIDNIGSPFWQFLQEQETIYGNFPYGRGYIRALKTLAVRNDYFSSVCILLFKISLHRKDVLDDIIGLLLPWHPNTTAPKKKRVNIFNKLNKINSKVSWELLLKLLPNVISVADAEIYPRYLSYKPLLPIKETEVLVTYKAYEEKALVWSEKSYERQKQLLLEIRCLFAEDQKQLLKLLQSEAEKEESLSIRYAMWTSLWHQYVEEKSIGRMEQSILRLLQKCIVKWKPKSIYYRAKRIFDTNMYELFSGKTVGREVLRNKQIFLQKRWLRKIYQLRGISGILEFATYVKEASQVGTLLPNLSYILEPNTLANMLVSEDSIYQQIAKGYVLEKYKQSPETVENIISPDWPNEQKYEFLLALPFTRKFWLIAEQILSDSLLQKYWQNKKVVGFEYHTFHANEYDFLIRKMVAVERWQDAIQLVELSIDRHEPCKVATILMVLLQYDQNTLDNMGRVQFCVQRAFSYLDKFTIDSIAVCNAAWRWFPVLNLENNVFQRTISKSPELFVLLLQKLFAPEDESTEDSRNIVSQIYTVFLHWQIVPGMNEKAFDEEVFSTWLQEVRLLAKEKSISEQAERAVGKVLFYAIGRGDESFLPNKIAEVLDENSNKMIREGFLSSAVNSLGVHEINEKAPIENAEYKKYKEFAEQADEEGYTDLAETLRKIADWFGGEAERIKRELS